MKCAFFFDAECAGTELPVPNGPVPSVPVPSAPPLVIVVVYYARAYDAVKPNGKKIKSEPLPSVPVIVVVYYALVYDAVKPNGKKN